MSLLNLKTHKELITAIVADFVMLLMNENKNNLIEVHKVKEKILLYRKIEESERYLNQILPKEKYDNEELIDIFIKEVSTKTNLKEFDLQSIVEIVLSIFDSKWQENIKNIEHIKEGVHLKSYAQKDPLTEFKIDSFECLNDMFDEIHSLVFVFILFGGKSV